MNPTREAVASLDALNEERGELLRKLDQALLIEERFPQAFAHGKCSIRWTVKAMVQINDDPDPLKRYVYGIDCGTLTDGAGNEYELPPEFARELGVTVTVEGLREASK